MDINEFREQYINDEINAEAVNSKRYDVEVFIDGAVDTCIFTVHCRILVNQRMNRQQFAGDGHIGGLLTADGIHIVMIIIKT